VTTVPLLIAAIAGVILFAATLGWLASRGAPAPLARFVAFLAGLTTMLLIIYAYKTT
jgi:hypothetical protein